MFKQLIIFTLYINVDRYSHQHTEQIMYELNNNIEDIFRDVGTQYNIKTIILPVENQPTKFECVFPNNPKNIDDMMIPFYEELLKKEYDELSMSNLKTIMRKVKINRLLKKGS